MSPANQPVVLMPFEDSQAGTYKCTGDGNMCGTPEDELTVFAGGKLNFRFFFTFTSLFILYFFCLFFSPCRSTS